MSNKLSKCIYQNIEEKMFFAKNPLFLSLSLSDSSCLRHQTFFFLTKRVDKYPQHKSTVVYVYSSLQTKGLEHQKLFTKQIHGHILHHISHIFFPLSTLLKQTITKNSIFNLLRDRSIIHSR